MRNLSGGDDRAFQREGGARYMPQMSDNLQPPTPDLDSASRRTFLTRITTVTAVGSVAVGYGGFAAVAGRYVYPAHPEEKRWLYVIDAASMKVGDAMTYQTPAGASVTVARQRETGEAADFIALSDTCPHLGCRVHWESQNNRFFCPCHNGVFTPDGEPVSGPPAEAGQRLSQYPLKIENGLLFIQTPIKGLPRGGLGAASA